METYRKVIIASGSVAGIAILVFAYFFFAPKKASPPVTPPPGKASSLEEIDRTGPPPASPSELEEISITPLDIPLPESDSRVREVLQTASAHPVFGRWLENRELIRKLVAVTDNIAAGQSPVNHLDFLRPLRGFQVKIRNGQTLIDPRGYERYDTAVTVFDSIDVKSLPALYRQLGPLLAEAYRELGYPDKPFKETLAEAVKVVLKAPVLEGDVFLEKKVISYAFKNPRLERLNPAQKHLLRLGPQNMKKIQAKLRQIADALHLDLDE